MLKFYGKFRDLIPNGWTFQKLFANNYRHYYKEIRPELHMRVWQHHGGYVELDDCFDNSEAVMKAALDNVNFPWKTHTLPMLNVWTDKKVAINRNTGEVTPWDEYTHDPMFVSLRMKQNGAKEEEINSVCNELCDTYRPYLITKEIVDTIQEMVDKHWIVLE